jgi:hypothetical protein
LPTKREREYYTLGFRDGVAYERSGEGLPMGRPMFSGDRYEDIASLKRGKPKRKLSAWQKYIKNKRNHIKYRDGKLNLKKMGVAFRRKQRR